MIINSGIVANAKAHGHKNGRLYVPPGGQRIDADEVVDLLANRTSPRAEPGARNLLREMAIRDWAVTAAVHKVGYGGDLTRHITVSVNGRQYHLRLDMSGNIFDITYWDGDLRLMRSVQDVEGIPTAGRSLIIVAAVKGVLHFRIFDHDGRMAVDEDETKLKTQAGPIEVLRKHLKELWPPHVLTRPERFRVIAAVTSIVGQTLEPRRLSGNLPWVPPGAL